MKIRIKKRFCIIWITFVIIALNPMLLRSQSIKTTTCSIQDARDYYNIGLFDDLKKTLDCFFQRSDITRNNKNQARELLALTAIAEDSIILSEALMKEIVLSDANYIPQNQNIVFEELFKRVRQENTRVTITSVSKRPEDIRTAPATVELIEASEIIARGYQDLTDLLSDVTGFEISKIHSVLYANIYQLGFRQENTERTLLMIDGIEQNDMWLNWAYLSRQYPLSNIKGVEIVYGPSSTMYGPRAFVGAINIITYGTKERAGNYFQKGAFSNNFYVTGNTMVGSFNTTDVDVTMGSASEDNKLNFQFTSRYFRSDEHDMSEEPFYNYNPDDLNKFEYDHLNFFASESLSVSNYLDQNNLSVESPYYTITDTSILLTQAGRDLALERDKTAYTGIVNGNLVDYSNHTEDYFIGFKLTLDKLLIGFNQWKRTEGFNFYQDVDVAPSRNGSVWSPENRTIYLKYDDSFSDNLSISVQSSFKNHRLGKESNRVNFMPFGRIGGLDLADLINYSNEPNNDLQTAHGWRNRYYFYQAQQGRTEIRLYYNTDRLSLVWGNDYRLTSTQGDYLIYMDYNYQSPNLSAYKALQDETAFAMEKGTVSGQNQGSNMFLVQDLGTYLQGSLQFGTNFFVSGGLRYDKNTIRYSDGFSVVTPRVGLLYNNDLSTIKLNYSRGFQNVSLFTMYSTGGGRVPNPNIKPEEIDYIDMSYYQFNNSKTLQFGITGFNYTVNNAVSSTILENGSPQNINAGKYKIFGVLTTLKYKLQDFRLDLNSTFFSPYQIMENGENLRIGDISSFRLNAGLTKTFETKKTNASINIRANFVGDKPIGSGTTQEINPGINGSSSIPAYSILNGNLLFQLKAVKQLTFGLTANNILNRIYYHPGPRTASGYFDLGGRQAGESYAEFLNNSIWNKNVPYVPQRPRNIQIRLLFDL
jgi:outer membrane receptor for ferrienterochelin and colicins